MLLFNIITTCVSFFSWILDIGITFDLFHSVICHKNVRYRGKMSAVCFTVCNDHGPTGSVLYIVTLIFWPFSSTRVIPVACAHSLNCRTMTAHATFCSISDLLTTRCSENWLPVPRPFNKVTK